MSRGTSDPKQPSPKVSTICLTPGCVLAASEILENLSPRYSAVDPCTNFDHFVCEGWSEKHDLRADQGSSFTGTLMAENSQQLLRHLLESPSPVDSKSLEVNSVAKQKILVKLHGGYQSCMDESKIKEFGSAPLIGVLRTVEKLFPVMKTSSPPGVIPNLQVRARQEPLYNSENHLSQTLVYLSRIGVSALVNFYVGVRSLIATFHVNPD